MAYGWMGSFRVGQWESLRRFVLNERRDLGNRMAVINNEVKKIGFITVIYKNHLDENGSSKTTEERIGFSVTENTSIHRLVRAYVAQGGNPLDVSYFFMPDQTVVDLDGNKHEKYPYGGVNFQISEDIEDTIDYSKISYAGWSPLRAYKPWRIGGKKDIDSDSEVFVEMIKNLRKPFNHEIRTRIHDIESRIIKLSDLKEQLITERDEILVQAFGSLSIHVPEFNSDRFSLALRVPVIINLIDKIFFSEDLDGNLIKKLNEIELSKYVNLYNDEPEEKYTTI